MTFNYYTEKKKFDRDWAVTEAFYREQGMSEEAIRAMYEYDWNLFKANRVDAIHTQEIAVESDSEDEEDVMESPLLMKFFEQFISQYDTNGSHSRYWWIEELTDSRLLMGLPLLTEEDKELLTLLFVDGYTQQESAVKMHITQGTMSYRIRRILTKFNKR